MSMKMKRTLAIIISILLSYGQQTRSYSTPASRRSRCRHQQPCHPTSPLRRNALISFLTILPEATIIGTSPAANAAELSSSDNEILQIKEATKALSALIDNWSKATTECIYADVPRELLESKNKDRLLEKASEFALFDKSTSVVSCKRTNRIVRDYIGATGKGPLVGIEKRLLRNTVVERVDPNALDEYFAAVESFSQSLSRATSLSYTAGMADFDSVNNFAKDDDVGGGGNGGEYADNSNLEQARKAIVEANDSLKKALSLISVDDVI
jgi:hypothetical protein